MSEINQVEVLIKPQVPKVIDNQQLLVYIPNTLITSVSNDFEIDYGQLKLKNPNVAYTDISNIFSKMQVFESNAMFDSGFSKVGGYDFTLPDKSGTIALLSDIVSGSGLVDDVRVNGQSIVENKVANIVVDTQANAQSSNPVANSLFTAQTTALGTTLSSHVNNKTNPHNVTAAQLGLGNVNTELAAVTGDISAHKKDTDNPHNVTAAQVGLGNVDNTSDMDKPVSTAQGAAIGSVEYALVQHEKDTTNPHSVTAAQVGLGAVNNTADADKPVSTKQAAAIKLVQDDVTAHKNNIKNPHMVTAAQVGLGNVNNTSDANKPVSTAQKAALDKKIDKTGGTFSGNVAIQGNLTVSGTTTTESEKQLAVKENVIVTNADKVNLQALLSGLAINKNSTATYGIMYDPADDTVKFGEGTLDANRKFVFKAGEGHPLAIRADSSQFTDAVLVKWNATTKAFEPASGTWQNLLNKIEITDIDLAFSDKTVLYNTTNGIQLSATGKITRKDGTSEQPQVDLDIPIVSGNGITIEKVANKEQITVKVNTSIVALKSDLTSYAKTTDLASYVKTTTLNTTLESYVKTATLNTTLEDYVKTTVLVDYVKTTTLNTTLANYVKTTVLNTTLADYAKTTDLAAYAKTVDVVEKSQVGAASGVASLGADGKVPAAQLPTIDNYSKFSEVKLQNSNIVPTYSATTGITVTSTGSMKHANNVVDTPTNTMVVPITAGKNMGATKSGNLVVFTANDQVGVGTTLPAGSSSQKIFINTAENTAKVYYNDNGTWKVVDVQGGGSSIDADTLNGLLSGTNGVTISKSTSGDKVEISGSELVKTYTPTSGTYVYATHSTDQNLHIVVSNNSATPSAIVQRTITGTIKAAAPVTNTDVVNLKYFKDNALASNNVKTLFGNESIVGTGNIDLYQHHILCSTPNEGIKVLITVISSKNLKVDSLTDLKTLLGNTFECPCTGYAMAQSQSLAICNENGFLPIDIWVNVIDPTPDVTWSKIESIVDTVTTI